MKHKPLIWAILAAALAVFLAVACTAQETEEPAANDAAAPQIVVYRPPT